LKNRMSVSLRFWGCHWAMSPWSLSSWRKGWTSCGRSCWPWSVQTIWRSLLSGLIWYSSIIIRMANNCDWSKYHLFFMNNKTFL
jgi:hypothetical protein